MVIAEVIGDLPEIGVFVKDRLNGGTGGGVVTIGFILI